jgi:hypothetical protein
MTEKQREYNLQQKQTSLQALPSTCCSFPTVSAMGSTETPICALGGKVPSGFSGRRVAVKVYPFESKY